MSDVGCLQGQRASCLPSLYSPFPYLSLPLPPCPILLFEVSVQRGECCTCQLPSFPFSSSSFLSLFYTFFPPILFFPFYPFSFFIFPSSSSLFFLPILFYLHFSFFCFPFSSSFFTLFSYPSSFVFSFLSFPFPFSFFTSLFSLSFPLP